MTETVTERPRRGRPKGSGRGLSASQRAQNSVMQRQFKGAKRVEVVLDETAPVALRYLRKYGYGEELTNKEVIERALLAEQRRIMNK